MRRPVRSNNITNRKLFNNGGFPTMGAQAQMPNPLNVNMGGTLPQANNIMAPSGILASSTELSNAVGDQALAQSFAPTANMNSGGIASFAHGGTHNATSFPGAQAQDYAADKLNTLLGEIGVRAKNVGGRLAETGSYLRSYVPPILGGQPYEEKGPEEVIQSTVTMLPTFGEVLGVTKDFKWQNFDNKDRLVLDKNFSFSTISADGSSMDAKTWFNETAPDTAERLFPGPFSRGNFIGAGKSVESMVEYMVKAKPEQEGAINYVTEKILSENPNIDPMDFREQMAVALKDMTEGQNSGILDIKQEGAANLYQDTQGQDTITLAESIDANKTPVDEIMEQMQDVSNYEPRPIDDSIIGENEIETDVDLAVSRWKATGYDNNFIETLRGEGKNDKFLSEVVARRELDYASPELGTKFYGEAGEAGEEDVLTVDIDIPIPPKVKEEVDETDGTRDNINIIAENAQQEIEDINKRNKAIANKPATEANVFEAASNAGDEIFVQQARGDGQESVNDTLDRFAKEFMDRMPKFKGKTENEKGWDLIALGSAIMGGTSSNALENIAKGFLATGDRFTEDDRAKRAYDNSIQMGAAKYSLQKLATQEALDAKNESTINWMVSDKAVTYNGQNYDKGSLIPVSAKSIIDAGGNIPSGLIDVSMFNANAKVVSDSNNAYKASIAKLEEDGTITQTNYNKKIETYAKITSTYRGSVAGKMYLDNAIYLLKNAPEKISGVTGKATDFYERFKTAFGGVGDLFFKTGRLKEAEKAKDWNAKDDDGNYINAERQAFISQVRLAFQQLIPAALAGVQSANSISNRDVQFLADAFIGGGILNAQGDDLVFSNVDVITNQLEATRNLFERKEQDLLERARLEWDDLDNLLKVIVPKDPNAPLGRGPASQFFPRYNKDSPYYLGNYQANVKKFGETKTEEEKVKLGWQKTSVNEDGLQIWDLVQ